jgi:hypothetical protein
MSAPETLTLRATAIAGERHADDYAVIWRGTSVGRIMLGNGAPHDRPQWTWSCHVHGRPQGSDDRGDAANLVDAKAKFKEASARIRASLTDQEIADGTTDSGTQRRNARAGALLMMVPALQSTS